MERLDGWADETVAVFSDRILLLPYIPRYDRLGAKQRRSGEALGRVKRPAAEKLRVGT